MGWIDYERAVELALSYPKSLKIPRTRTGIDYVAKKYGFAKRERIGTESPYYRTLIEKEGLLRFLDNAKEKIPIIEISKKYLVPPTLMKTYLYNLNIRGERTYGKIYVTKEEGKSIIKYIKNKKANRKKK